MSLAVFKVRRIRPWLKSFLPKDPRFTREVVKEMVTFLHNEARGFLLEDRTTVESLMREWFMSRTKSPDRCPSLFKKPSPPPPAPLRAIWVLQRADDNLAIAGKYRDPCFKGFILVPNSRLGLLKIASAWTLVFHRLSPGKALQVPWGDPYSRVKSTEISFDGLIYKCCLLLG
jgi:hypothetical protein